MSNASTTPCFSIGRFEVRPVERRISKDGRAIELGGRAFDVLVLLVERSGSVVTQAELLAHVWRGTVVEENNVQAQISALRKVLGSDAIETVRGRGYRFALDPLQSPSDRLSRDRPRAQNLPRPQTSFIGREQALSDLQPILANSRLLTLTGLGGCGKTRLAIELGSNALMSFADGVWFVDLSGLPDAEHIALATARMLDVQQQPDRAIGETLCEEIKARSLLLIFDNCEHLLAGCAAFIERVLDAAPHVRVLATSREPFNIAGERIAVVRPLTTPSANADWQSALVGSEAVRLFIDRAKLAAAEVSLQPELTKTVIEICRRLDGIPLAIELAASRVKLLSVEQINERLSDRFQLLGRHARWGHRQTLLETLQWSYQHLSIEEQTLLRRLSVFTAGCTLAAATAVASPFNDELQTLELLERLVDKSLVVIERRPFATRMSMLETVREFARQMLVEAGEESVTRDRHLAYFASVATAAKDRFLSNDVTSVVRSLDEELPNFLDAQAYSSSQGGSVVLGLSLLAGLSYYCHHRGLPLLCVQLMREALMRPTECSATPERAEVLRKLALLLSQQGEYSQAQRFLQESLDIARLLDDPGEETRALLAMAQVATEAGNMGLVEQHLGTAVRLARETSDANTLLAVLNMMGAAMRLFDRQDEARAVYEEAIEIGRTTESGMVSAIALNLACVATATGDLEAALRCLIEVSELEGTDPTEIMMARFLEVTVGLSSAWGDVQFSAWLWGRCEAMREKCKRQRSKVDSRFLAPFIERVHKDLGEQRMDVAFQEGATASLSAAFDAAMKWVRAGPRPTHHLWHTSRRVCNS